jgi:hypothetical protein
MCRARVRNASGTDGRADRRTGGQADGRTGGQPDHSPVIPSLSCASSRAEARDRLTRSPFEMAVPTYTRAIPHCVRDDNHAFPPAMPLASIARAGSRIVHPERSEGLGMTSFAQPRQRSTHLGSDRLIRNSDRILAVSEHITGVGVGRTADSVVFQAVEGMIPLQREARSQHLCCATGRG